MAIEQFILLVVVPLLAAPVAAVMPRGRIAWLVALLVSWFCLMGSVQLLAAVLETGPLSYHLGGWPPPWGIEYRVDAVNAFIALIVSGIAAVTMPYALLSVEREIPRDLQPLFYATFLLCLTGLLGIVLTGDVFNLFVFLEISSLSSYALIAMGRDRKALTAAYQYLIMGTIGATFLLIGIGLLYAETGTLNMLDLSERIQGFGGSGTVATAFAFIVVGVAIKLALFPLHLWLPGAYAEAPSVVSVFLAATATKVALYVLLRILFTVFSPGFTAATPTLELLLIMGSVGVVVASVSAIFQTDVKRILAQSSVAQIGYLGLGVGLGTSLGLTASLVHAFNHALMKGALFMAVGVLIYQIGSSRLGALEGAGRRMPWTMMAIVIAGLSLIGIPGTAGFISKWYLVLAAIESGAWSIAVVVLAGSLLAVIYLWRVVEILFFRGADAATTEGVGGREAPLWLLVPTWILVGANLVFGLWTGLTVGVAETAAAVLLGNGP